MDFIRKYDIELEKEQYYAGETLRGLVVIENAENLRITGVQVGLRGKAHVEWRITRGGERRTVKEDQFFIDKKIIIWGKDAEAGDDGAISILERGEHRLPFEFQLPPDQSIPCSFESRIGTIRYYLRVIIFIPYASPPQGLKYFTVIGPHTDCLDDRYTMPLSASRQSKNRCILCACTSGTVSLDACLERGAYCCGEYIRLKCDITNGSDQDVTLACRLVQYVEYRINKGALGMNKDVTHHVLEYHSAVIPPQTTRSFHDLHRELQVPVMPPTLSDICRVIEIYYVLKVAAHMEKSGEDMQVEFPFVVATVPFREPGGSFPEITYEPADDHVEGGIYISPEFQLGQVYDGAADVVEDVILYRPVYVCAPRPPGSDIGNGHSPSVRGVDRTPSPSPGDGGPGGGIGSGGHAVEQAGVRSPTHHHGGKTKKATGGGGGDGADAAAQQPKPHRHSPSAGGGGSSTSGGHVVHAGGSHLTGRSSHEIIVHGILQTTASPERRPTRATHDVLGPATHDVSTRATHDVVLASSSHAHQVTATSGGDDSKNVVEPAAGDAVVGGGATATAHPTSTSTESALAAKPASSTGGTRTEGKDDRGGATAVIGDVAKLADDQDRRQPPAPPHHHHQQQQQQELVREKPEVVSVAGQPTVTNSVRKETVVSTEVIAQKEVRLDGKLSVEATDAVSAQNKQVDQPSTTERDHRTSHQEVAQPSVEVLKATTVVSSSTSSHESRRVVTTSSTTTTQLVGVTSGGSQQPTKETTTDPAI